MNRFFETSFILNAPLTPEDTCEGIPCALEITHEGRRLLAIDLNARAAGRFRGWLLASAETPGKLEVQLYQTGISIRSDDFGYAYFQKLASEGRATELPLHSLERENLLGNAAATSAC